MKSIVFRYVQFFSIILVALSFGTILKANNKKESELIAQIKAVLSHACKKMNDKQSEQLRAELSSVIDIAAQVDEDIDIQSLLNDISKQLAQLEYANSINS